MTTDQFIDALRRSLPRETYLTDWSVAQEGKTFRLYHHIEQDEVFCEVTQDDPQCISKAAAAILLVCSQ